MVVFNNALRYDQVSDAKYLLIFHYVDLCYMYDSETLEHNL
jgi:hypothetical protein